MKKFTLTREEKEIENALLSGEFKPVKGKELENIEKALKSRKKDKLVRSNRFNYFDRIDYSYDYL